ncbi:hypothetical protein SAMN04487905_1099 [Actinopolyspora xinjiangensis]|uniref:Uncharacterized protein n=1 Tax=Actinopolyspora xinjiangensis TaxID=405564 RepID=A0A1H0VIQ2_9ACTN|nr:hypothetical protein SAMN04487905_1099 [Actinopolyspora xinjiangensis]
MWVLKSSKGSLKSSVPEPRVACEGFEEFEEFGMSPRAELFGPVGLCGGAAGAGAVSGFGRDALAAV